MSERFLFIFSLFMEEVVVKVGVPEDLKEIAEISEAEISLAVTRFLKKRLLEIAEIERILSKSKLSEGKGKGN